MRYEYNKDRKKRESYVERYKAPRNKFWDGLFYGIIIGYVPYIVHMNQWLK